MHAEMDRDSAAQNKRRQKKPDTFDQYRQNPRQNSRYNRRPPNQLNRPQHRISTGNQNAVLPSIKRQYRPEAVVRRRYKARDLTDNQHDGSLWSGQGNDNYLFTQNKKKRNGDIILINVFKTLKDEITAELSRATPKPPVSAKKEGEEKKPAAPVANAPKKEENPSKVQDRISSVIIEEINKDHILLRGQKYLLYKNKKRLVEVQALVARRDISDDDAVNSDNILESSVHVIR
jgi:flagellar basal body L-ring protein FlgH